MHRIIKLISIFVISLSVYWVYQKTSNSYYQIMSLGDQFSLGNTSYGVIENSYLDDMKEILLKTKENIEINQTYNEKDQSIKNCLQSIQNTPNIKKDLYDTDVLVISLGYNDLLYRLSIEENDKESNVQKIIEEIENDYKKLIEEIRKYYKEDIIVLGYIEDSRFDGNKQIGIQKLNKILKNNKEVIFIDVNELLKDREKYYSNPRSHYPNALGYKRIATKIIQKTLENKENV
ncbi:MAG: hypothetical protein IKF71_00535 [Bacilli bacterium]|nr:hypothetical protein [Bacilli bacterium]